MDIRVKFGDFMLKRGRIIQLVVLSHFMHLQAIFIRSLKQTRRSQPRHIQPVCGPDCPW